MAAGTQLTASGKPDTAASSAAQDVRTEVHAASRSSDRMSPPIPRPVKVLAPSVQMRPAWTTARLNVWSGPGEGSSLLTVLDPQAKVRGTGTVRGAWAQIEWKNRKAW